MASGNRTVGDMTGGAGCLTFYASTGAVKMLLLPFFKKGTETGNPASAILSVLNLLARFRNAPASSPSVRPAALILSSRL